MLAKLKVPGDSGPADQGPGPNDLKSEVVGPSDKNETGQESKAQTKITVIFLAPKNGTNHSVNFQGKEIRFDHTGRYIAKDKKEIDFLNAQGYTKE
jgi:hypothetical protein